jgi:hypothetical protein
MDRPVANLTSSMAWQVRRIGDGDVELLRLRKHRQEAVFVQDLLADRAQHLRIEMHRSRSSSGTPNSRDAASADLARIGNLDWKRDS